MARGPSSCILLFSPDYYIDTHTPFILPSFLAPFAVGAGALLGRTGHPKNHPVALHPGIITGNYHTAQSTVRRFQCTRVGLPQLDVQCDFGVKTDRSIRIVNDWLVADRELFEIIDSSLSVYSASVFGGEENPEINPGASYFFYCSTGSQAWSPILVVVYTDCFKFRSTSGAVRRLGTLFCVSIRPCFKSSGRRSPSMPFCSLDRIIVPSLKPPKISPRTTSMRAFAICRRRVARPPRTGTRAWSTHRRLGILAGTASGASGRALHRLNDASCHIERSLRFLARKWKSG